MRTHADVDDAARLDDVQSLLAGGGDQLIAIAAGVEPQLLAAAGGDFGQYGHADVRRQIDADPVELPRRDFRQRLVSRQPLNDIRLGIHRIDRIPLLLVGPDGLVAELAPVGGRAEDGDGGHDGL